MAANSVVRTIKVVGVSEGLADLARDVREVGKAHTETAKSTEAAARVTDTASKRALSVEGAYNRLMGTLDANTRATQQMERAQRTLDRAFQQSLIDTTQYARAMDMLNAKYDASTIAANRDAQAAAALRAQINPLAVAQGRLNSELSEYTALASRGAITARELAAAQALAKSRFDASTASVRAQTAAMNDNVPRQGFLPTANIAAQFQDIGVTAAMGMSPLQIALQQGTQLSAVFNDLKASGQGVGRALFTAFTSIISPVSLLTLGIVAAGAAAIQWFMKGADKAKDFDKAIQLHTESVEHLKVVYGETTEVMRAMENAGTSKVFSKALIAIDTRSLEKQLTTQLNQVWKKVTDDELIREINSEVELGGSDFDAHFGALTLATDTYQNAVSKLLDSIRSGNTDLQGFRDSLLAARNEAVAAGGSVTSLTTEMLGLEKSARQLFGDAESEFSAFQQPLNEFFLGLQEGKKDFDPVLDKIGEIGDANGMEDQARKVFELIGKVMQLNAEIEKTAAAEAAAAKRVADAYRQYANSRIAGPDAKRSMDELEQQRISREEAVIDAQIKQAQARTDAERIAAAATSAAAEAEESLATAAEKSLAVSRAVRQEQAAINREIADGVRERTHAREEDLKAAQEELTLVGKNTAEVAALRYEHEQLAQLRQTAFETNRAIDQADVAAIKERAAEIGKLAEANKVAQYEYAAGRSREEALTSAREELTLVGKSAIEAGHLRAEYQMMAEARRALDGGPVSAEELARIKDAAASLAQLNQALIVKNAQEELSFERSILGLSDNEKRIRESLYNKGIDYDSPEGEDLAAQMRYLDNAHKIEDQMDELRKAASGVFADMFSGPMDDMDAFFDKLIDNFARIGQMNLENAFDQLFGVKGASKGGSGFDLTAIGKQLGSFFSGRGAGGGYTAGFPSAPTLPRNDSSPSAQISQNLAKSMEVTSKSALDVARQFEGLNERADSKVLDGFLRASGNWKGLSAQDTAWCASFANAAIMQSGGQGTGSNLASSFMNWGSATNAPKPGDVVVLRPQSRGASGHVGFVAGFGDGTVQVFGGNQSNGANTKSFGLDQVMGYRTDGNTQAVLAKGVEEGMIGATNKLGIDPWSSGGVNMRQAVAGAPGAAPGGNALGGQGGMGLIGAGLGAFGMGAQSGSALSGALGGAMSGFSAGGLPGALIGGVAGLFGGIFGKSRQRKAEQDAAKKALKEQAGAIEDMLDFASGTISGSITRSMREYRDEVGKAIELAGKAGDTALKKRLKASVGELEARLIKDFADAYEGTIEGLNKGLGLDNPFSQGFDAVKKLREELLAFVDDAKTAGLALDEAIGGASGKAGSAANSNNLNEYQARDLINRHQRGEDISQYSNATWGLSPFSGDKDNGGPNSVYMEQLFAAREAARAQALAKAKDAAEGAAEAERQLSDARKAAINQALAVLTGPTEITDIAQEMMELRGKAAALPDVLKDLGLTSEQAAQRIEESLGQAIAKIRDTFTKDLIDQIDDLDGKGYLPEFRDLFETIEDMMSDAKLIGADTALVDAFFKKSAQSIVDGSQLAGSAFDALIAQFPQLAGVVRQYHAILARSAEETRKANQEYLSGRLTIAINERASAESDLLSAYNTAKDRLEGLQSRIKDFLADIRLNDNSPLSGQDQFREAQKAYQETLAKANAGDEEAQEKLVSVSQDYLSEARAYYASSEAYQAVWDEINRTLGGASVKAQSQLDVMKSQVSRLIDINSSTLTVAQAVAKVEAAVREVAKAEGALNGARDWGVNASFNKALTDALSKAGLNYTGNFGAGAFTQWQGGLSTTDLDRVQQIINGLGGIPTTQPAQNLGANPVRNTSIVSGLSGAGLNYSGGFGAGQFSAWVQSLPPAQKAIADAIANQYAGIGYAQGGYTGAGGVNEIAGLAHKGEVYFSQADVSRWGGPAQVENLRRGPQVSNDNRVVAAIDRLTEENRALREEVRSLTAVTAQGALTVAGKVEEGNSVARSQAGVAKRRAAA